MVLFRSLEDIEDVRREVQIMHHLSGHENITKLRGAYEDRHHVHLVRRRDRVDDLNMHLSEALIA